MTLDRRTLLAAAVGAAATPLAASAAPAPGGTSSRDPLGVRGDFPITATDMTYLNTAYNAPIPRQVIAAGQSASEHKALEPVGRDLNGSDLNSAQEIRERFSALINAAPDEIGLLRSTGEGENTVARGLDMKAGDNVVMSSLHYDSEFILYRALERELGIEFRLVPHRDGVVDASDIARFVDKRTRLVTVAMVSHQNGYVHDLKSIAEVAHASGAYLFADAIQGAGTIAIDVKASNVDFLCSGAHKWLLGTFGVSAFYIRRDLFGRLKLDRYGEEQISRRFPNRRYEFYEDARRFEFSPAATLPAAQLSASLEYIQKVGLARIEAHTVGLGLKLQRELARQGHRMFTPEGNRSPIVVFYAKTPSNEAKSRFAAAKVNVTARDGTVRISPALFNTEADIDRCLEVTKTLE